MAITDYKPVFSDYHHGATSFIHILSKPIATTRDTVMTQDDTYKLKDARFKSARNISTTLAFCGKNNTEKALQLNQLAYFTKQSVCFIDCQRLVQKYIGETEKNLLKLIAQAESEHWILFFDEADALFDNQTRVQDTHDKYANQEISYLLKRLSRYPGLAIFSLLEKSRHQAIQYMVDSVITFRPLK
ncbi:AAA family ATPase [uncultured Paraglaciecola sp.]|uniref:AAA family ATPase n=1 Tax=uncultured Paraglaciecola sp. TaxID=1765024 RepID=UPI0030D930E9